VNLPLVANLVAKSSVRCDFRLEYAVGEVAEWSKAAVLKTVDGQPSGGSNPSLSANHCRGSRISGPSKLPFLPFKPSGAGAVCFR
jgi:hypothetical protein